MLGDIHRLLPRRRIRNQQDFLWRKRFLHVNQLLHEFLIDVQPASRVKDNQISLLRLGEGHRLLGDFHHIGFAAHRKHRNLHLFAECLQLVNRRRPIHVACDQQWLASLFREQLRQFPARCRFAASVQPHHHPISGFGVRRLVGALPFVFPHQRHQFIMHNLDDLLSRGDAVENLLSERPLLRLLNEILGDLVVDVGFQQRQPHLAQRIGNVLLRQLAVPAQVLEHRLQFL